MLDLSKQQAFIPEKYVIYLDMLVQTDNYGKGVMIEASELSNLIKEGKIHSNCVLHRAVVYVTKETAVTPKLSTTEKLPWQKD